MQILFGELSPETASFLADLFAAQLVQLADSYLIYKIRLKMKKKQTPGPGSFRVCFYKRSVHGKIGLKLVTLKPRCLWCFGSKM